MHFSHHNRKNFFSQINLQDIESRPTVGRHSDVLFGSYSSPYPDNCANYSLSTFRSDYDYEYDFCAGGLGISFCKHSRRRCQLATKMFWYLLWVRSGNILLVVEMFSRQTTQDALAFMFVEDVKFSMLFEKVNPKKCVLSLLVARSLWLDSRHGRRTQGWISFWTCWIAPVSKSSGHSWYICM